MKVVFVYPDVIGRGRRWPGSYHHGLSSISAVLKASGHNTALIHVKGKISKREFFYMLEKENPDILGFTATTNQFPLAFRLGKWAREILPDTKMVLGGNHVTLDAENVATMGVFDYLCIGEGEEPMAELCNALEFDGETRHIKNVWAIQGDNVYRNPIRPLVDLNSLPFPDKSLFDYEELEFAKQGKGAFLASKGCPYNCNYCCNAALRNLYQSKVNEYVRFKRVDYMIEEIRQELKNYPFVKKIYFEDDILPLKMDWFREFTEAYKNEISLPFICNLSPILADSEVMDILHKAGCEQIQMGIETGNEELRLKLLKRKITNDRLYSAFEACKKDGIKSFSFNMVGLPDESISDMLETVKMNARLLVDKVVCNIFYPYPGTELHRFSLERGLITEKEVPSYGYDTVFKVGRINRQQILFVHKYFPLLVALYRWIYSFRPYRRKLLENIVDRVLKAYPVAVLVYPILIWAYAALRSYKTTERIGRVLLENYLFIRKRRVIQ